MCLGSGTNMRKSNTWSLPQRDSERERDHKLMIHHVPDTWMLQDPHSALNLQLPISQHSFKENKLEASLIYLLMPLLWLCVSMCVFNKHGGRRRRASGWKKGSNLTFSFYPPCFAFSIPAMTKALSEAQRPLQEENKVIWTQTMIPSANYLFQKCNLRI